MFAIVGGFSDYIAVYITRDTQNTMVGFLQVFKNPNVKVVVLIHKGQVLGGGVRSL